MCIFQKPFFAISEGVFLILYKVRSFDFSLSDKINYYHLTLCWKAEYADKICIVKAMVFPVITFDCESWTMKKAEH